MILRAFEGRGIFFGTINLFIILVTATLGIRPKSYE